MKEKQIKIDNNINHELNKRKSFDVETICKAFENFNQNETLLNLNYYLVAFKEIEKLFQNMGPIFKFVNSDLDNKINILNNYLNDEKIGKNYQYIQNMIEYERKENILRDSKRLSGSRTLLRLHRALEFISLFLLELSKLNDDENINSMASNVYEKTLKKYHTWLIGKTSKLALYTLPVREVFIKKLFFHEKQLDCNEINESMIRISELANIAFKNIEKIYVKENLSDLP